VYADECESYTCVAEISGAIERTQTVSTSGMFKAAAGVWNGELDVRESCGPSTPHPEAHEGCWVSEWSPSEPTKVVFTATVESETATIAWDYDNEEGTISVLGRSDGLDVDGTSVPKTDL
jgi:hypothetical protein